MGPIDSTALVHSIKDPVLLFIHQVCCDPVEEAARHFKTSIVDLDKSCQRDQHLAGGVALSWKCFCIRVSWHSVRR